MKKCLPYLLVAIMTVIMIVGCKPLLPEDYKDFDLGDTVDIKIGEKLYFEKDFWFRLDSIKDLRNPIQSTYTYPGYYEAWMSITKDDSTIEAHFSSAIFNGGTLCMSFFPESEEFLTYWYYIRILSLSPEPEDSLEIADEDYALSFVLQIEGAHVDKPNIYLYPEKKTKITVSLDLPDGGKVTESIPAYPKNWKNIRVKPDGTINRKYDFLFYEADLPGDWQFDKGWVVAQKDLKFFFQNNLRDYGFNKKEIKDFTDWWMPKLKDHPYYEIYPQHTAKIESIVPLKISKEFDSLLRLFYFVDGADDKRVLPEPKIPEYERDGFVVTEWGVSIR
jgi:hypothetical protein